MDPLIWTGLSPQSKLLVAHLITAAEQAKIRGDGNLAALRAALAKKIAGRKVPVVGITGTGGAGKSSLTDEIILRILHDLEDIHVAVISCDPSRRKTGGALLGDRIRMNAIGNPRVYLRSLATRQAQTEIPAVLTDAIAAVKAAGFDLIIVETAGIGQGDSSIVDLVDVAVYVMTSEFGAASQLEKIDMLDFADLVVVNKFEKRGGEDAVRDVRKQVQRNRAAFDRSPAEMPVFGTIASKFNDDGVTALYHAILDTIQAKIGVRFDPHLPRPETRISSSKTIIIPPERTRYLSEIADTIREYHRKTNDQSQAVRNFWHLQEALQRIGGSEPLEDSAAALERLKEEVRKAEAALDLDTKPLPRGMEADQGSLQQGRTGLQSSQSGNPGLAVCGIAVALAHSQDRFAALSGSRGALRLDPRRKCARPISLYGGGISLETGG